MVVPCPCSDSTVQYCSMWQRNLSPCNAPDGAAVSLHIPVLLSYPRYITGNVRTRFPWPVWSVLINSAQSWAFQGDGCVCARKIREGISFLSPLIKTCDVVKCARCLSPLLHQAPTEVYFQAYLPKTCASKFKIGKLLLNDTAQFSLLEVEEYYSNLANILWYCIRAIFNICPLAHIDFFEVVLGVWVRVLFVCFFSCLGGCCGCLFWNGLGIL